MVSWMLFDDDDDNNDMANVGRPAWVVIPEHDDPFPTAQPAAFVPNFVQPPVACIDN